MSEWGDGELSTEGLPDERCWVFEFRLGSKGAIRPWVGGALLNSGSA